MSGTVNKKLWKLKHYTIGNRKNNTKKYRKILDLLKEKSVNEELKNFYQDVKNIIDFTEKTYQWSSGSRW